jgi:ketosteroid isomerase-like protein
MSVIRQPALWILFVLISIAQPLSAQTTQGVTEPDPLKAIAPPADMLTVAVLTPASEPDALKAIAQLRGELIDSFNKRDIDRLISHLDPDVVVTWQNGEVCRGPQAVREYYNRMIAGPDPVVASFSSDPVVTDRHVYGDWAVSWGNLHDKYELKDGEKFTLDSLFTATIARRADAWKVTSFHASVNAFDNPILGIAAKKSAMWSGIIAAVVGALIGILVGRILARRKAAAPR